MNKQREALDALEGIHPGNMTPMAEQAWNKAIIALREALAEPEQKPVAVVTSQTGDPAMTMSWHHEPALPIGTKLYAAPPARKSLTDEDISAIVQSMSAYTWDAHMLARAIERAHGITE